MTTQKVDVTCKNNSCNTQMLHGAGIFTYICFFGKYTMHGAYGIIVYIYIIVYIEVLITKFGKTNQQKHMMSWPNHLDLSWFIMIYHFSPTKWEIRPDGNFRNGVNLSKARSHKIKVMFIIYIYGSLNVNICSESNYPMLDMKPGSFLILKGFSSIQNDP